MNKYFLYLNSTVALKIYLALSLTLIGILLLICRNPDPFIHPVMYAEDGVWTGLGLTHGWLYPLFYARPDYLVVGNITLLWLATYFSMILFGNPIVHLPESIAFISCAFYSMVAVLAFYSTKGLIPLIFRGVLFFLLLLIPLGLTQNEIIGRISNIGYYMSLIAIILFYFKSRCNSVISKSAIDFFLLLCAATNPVIIGFAVIYFIWDCLQDSSIPKALSRNVGLNISLLGLSIYLLPRMLRDHPAHLQTFDVNQVIESISARAILFPVIFPWYSRCSNLLSIFLLIGWIALIIYCYLRSKNIFGKRLMFFLSAGLLVTVAATLVMRPGLTTILHEYQTTFPDRYFMGMNVIAVFLTVIALGQLGSLTENKLVFLGWMGLGTISLIYLFHLPLIFEKRSPEWLIMTKPTFEDQVKSVPAVSDSISVEVPIYPIALKLKMQIPSKWVNMLKNEKQVQ